MEAIGTARKKVKALIKLAVDSYRRRDMVADLGRFELEEKSYSSLSNELNGVCVGTADAKLGIGTFTNILGLACRKPGEPREYALRALDELEKIAGRVAFEIPEVDIDDPAFTGYFGKIAYQAGHAMEVFGRHMSDGTLDAREAGELADHLLEVIRVVAATKRATPACGAVTCGGLKSTACGPRPRGTSRWWWRPPAKR